MQGHITTREQDHELTLWAAVLMLIMVVATTATTVASHDRWKLPTPEWKAPSHPSPAETGGGDAPGPVVRSPTVGSIVPTRDDERSENSGLFYGSPLSHLSEQQWRMILVKPENLNK